MGRLRDLILRATKVLTDEAAGRLGSIDREGALITLDGSPAVVVGDIHGDMEALMAILRDSEISGRLSRGWRLVMLGDYADRGPDPLDVYEAILELKLDHPANVILMRGNHEAMEIAPVHPHDLPERLRVEYGSSASEVYESLLALHSLLPSAVIHGGRTLIVHGGVFKGISRASLVNPTRNELEMLLWNDPYEEAEGISFSPRGAGVRFGPSVTGEALAALGLGQVVRGHSAVSKGHRFNHGGRVLTVFSAKNVYGLKSGSYLVLEPGRSIGESVRVF